MDVEGLTSYLSEPSHRHMPHHFRAIIIIAAAVIGLPIGIFFGFVKTHTVNAQITGFYWQRSVVQQELGWNTHQDWNIPDGGVETSRSWEYHYTQYIPVIVGKVTVINQYPVYDWLYTYKIYEWYDLQTVKAAGQDQHPVWPKIQTDQNHRPGQTNESYSVVLHTSQKDYNYNLSESQWSQLQLGQFVSLKMNRVGMILAVQFNNG